jgi:hypothetical protein
MIWDRVREPSSPSAPSFWRGGRPDEPDNPRTGRWAAVFTAVPGPEGQRPGRTISSASHLAAPLSFSSPSYTHRPWFTRPAAQRRSWAAGRIPTNDLVWGSLEIGSRPPKPSPGSHMPRGLGRERLVPTYPTLVPAHRPALYLVADMAPMGTTSAVFAEPVSTISAVLTEPVSTMSTVLTAVSTDRPTLYLSLSTDPPYTYEHI